MSTNSKEYQKDYMRYYRSLKGLPALTETLYEQAVKICAEPLQDYVKNEKDTLQECVKTLQNCVKILNKTLQDCVKEESRENPENSPKNAVSAENSVNFTHAGGVGGVLFNNTTCTPVDTFTRSNVSTKEKTYKKEKFENDFETFWTAWPRHFRKARKKLKFDEVLQDNKKLADLIKWGKR